MGVVLGSRATTLSVSSEGRSLEAPSPSEPVAFGCRIFIPEYTQELQLELLGCASNGSLGCPVRLTVGSATLPSNFQKVLTCTGPTRACRLLLPSPPWDRWLQVTAKNLAGPYVSVAFSAVAALTGGLHGEGGVGVAVPRACDPQAFLG